MLRLGNCYLKKGDKDQAIASYQTLVQQYPDQKDPVAQATAALAKLGGGGDNSPHIVKTSPPVFSDRVDPSLDKLSVTFDRRMSDNSWAWVQRYPDKYPKVNGKPSYDSALSTCSVSVKLEPGKVYWIEFNSPPYIGFYSESGVSARKSVMPFATAVPLTGRPRRCQRIWSNRPRPFSASAAEPATSSPGPRVQSTFPPAFAKDVDPSHRQDHGHFRSDNERWKLVLDRRRRTVPQDHRQALLRHRKNHLLAAGRSRTGQGLSRGHQQPRQRQELQECLGRARRTVRDPLRNEGCRWKHDRPPA